MILSIDKKIEEKFYKKKIIDLCNEFIEKHDLGRIPCGKYLIDGEDFFVNVVSYDTKKETECIWEAHRQYIDIHYIINGKEKIRVANVNDMQIQEYIDEIDYVKMEGQASAEINLQENKFLILFFEDAHMTGEYIEQPQKIKKAIFKINVSYLEE